MLCCCIAGESIYTDQVNLLLGGGTMVCFGAVKMRKRFI